jgi:hypothetical protein
MELNDLIYKNILVMADNKLSQELMKKKDYLVNSEQKWTVICSHQRSHKFWIQCDFVHKIYLNKNIQNDCDEMKDTTAIILDHIISKKFFEQEWIKLKFKDSNCKIICLSDVPLKFFTDLNIFDMIFIYNTLHTAQTITNILKYIFKDSSQIKPIIDSFTFLKTYQFLKITTSDINNWSVETDAESESKNLDDEIKNVSQTIQNMKISENKSHHEDVSTEKLVIYLIYKEEQNSEINNEQQQKIVKVLEDMLSNPMIVPMFLDAERSFKSDHIVVSFHVKKERFDFFVITITNILKSLKSSKLIEHGVLSV